MKHSGNIALLISACMLTYLVIDKVSDQTKKVGVVQMDKLVYDFKGMKEATKNYENKVQKWNSESDSLETRLRQIYGQIRLDSVSKDKEKLARDIQMFRLYKKSLMEYNQNAEQNAAKADEQMTLGVINQVNDYIKAYAKEKGYDVILCNSQNQSVGFAREQIDVTEEVLAYANSKYEGK
jgi:outer membrane protein